MKFVSELQPEDQWQLQYFLKTSVNHPVRQGIHALLLSVHGYAIDSLANIIAVYRSIVSEWLDL